jgi:hypothetical protein
MASLISAGTSTNTAVSITGDTTGALALATNNGTTAVTIDTSQNVGVGTASPAYKLHVVKPSAGVTGRFTDGDGITDIYGYGLEITRPTGYIKTSGALQLGGANGYNDLVINSSGNVGIGTTSPTATGGYDKAIDLVGGSNGAGLYIRGATNPSTVYASIQYDNYSNRTNINAVGTSNFLRFVTVDTERMRITSAGNVGIATTSPASSLEIYKAVSTTGSLTDASLMLSTTATTGRKVSIGFGLGGGIANTCAAVIGYDVISGTGAGYGDIYFSTRSTTADSVPTERMRVTNDGTIRIGMQNFAAAVSSSNFGMSLNNTNAGSYSYAYSTTTNTHWGFGNGNGGTGSIQTNGSTTSFNTTSDHRLKQNVVPMTGGLARVQALKPVTYKWKVDGADGEGFIAHELQEVCSHAVTGEKDAVDENGDPVYQQVDTSFLVATLTAAIQELKTIVDAQAVEIAALKAKVGS